MNLNDSFVTVDSFNSKKEKLNFAHQNNIGLLK